MTFGSVQLGIFFLQPSEASCEYHPQDTCESSRFRLDPSRSGCHFTEGTLSTELELHIRGEAGAPETATSFIGRNLL